MDDVDGLGAIRRGIGRDALLFQNSRRNLAVQLVVLDQQRVPAGVVVMQGGIFGAGLVLARRGQQSP